MLDFEERSGVKAAPFLILNLQKIFDAIAFVDFLFSLP